MAGRTNKSWIWLGLVLGGLVLAVLDVCCGAVWIGPSEIIHSDSAVVDRVFFYLRLPKMLTAVLAGCALSVSGVMMQTLFRNPLAGPYILGVSSGAGLGVAIVTILGAQMAWHWLSFTTAGAAIIGSVAVMLLMLAVARRVRDNVSLLIVGMMFGSIAGALVNVLQNISNPDALKMFIVWTLGSLSNVGWSQLGWMALSVAAGLIIVVGLIKPLNGLMLGENYARALGVRIEQVRVWIVIATGLLAGGVTAFCGPIAFVGVAVPHIARGIMQTSNHRIIVPASLLIGANLLLLCDLLCSWSVYPLPISTVSALVGAPVIIRIVLNNK
ncbi:MAG: iron ABC transporter permease [Paludibacteraceae bacterium]|nr:iron ABC transporter permease [Paludibacteraceae bacterium]